MKKVYLLIFIAVGSIYGCDLSGIGDTLQDYADEQNDKQQPDEAPGELGHGFFSYVCVGPDNPNYDPACYDSPWPTPVNAPGGFNYHVAVGSRFKLTYRPKSYMKDSFKYISPDPSGHIDEVENGELKILGSGSSAVLAFDQDGDTIDRIHMQGSDIADLHVTPTDAAFINDDYMFFPKNYVNDFRAFPSNVEGLYLVGYLNYSWKSSNDEIVRVISSGTESICKLGMVGIGTAILTIETEGYVKQIEVTVYSEEDAGVDAGE
jgi:hypothetical protein